MAIVRVASHGSFNGLPSNSGAGLAPPPGGAGTINNRIAVASPVLAGNFMLVFGYATGVFPVLNLITDTRGNTYTIHLNTGSNGNNVHQLFFAVGEIVTPLQTGDFVYINRNLDRDIKCVLIEYSGLAPHGEYWRGNASRAYSPGAGGTWATNAANCGTLAVPRPDSLVLGLILQYFSYPAIGTPAIVTPGAGWTNEAGVTRTGGGGDDSVGFDWVSAITSGDVSGNANPTATMSTSSGTPSSEGGYGMVVALAPAINPIRMTV